MGLDVSHDAWSGPYSAFSRLRRVICEAAGGSWPPHDDAAMRALEAENGVPPSNNHFYVGDDFPEADWPGLWCFLSHSDCDGEIEPDMAAKVADDLERILPRIEVIESTPRWRRSMIGRPSYSERTRQFIAGCRLAHSRNERMRFA